MSQKTQVYIEEKNQFNILEEFSNFTIRGSLLIFIGLAFLIAKGHQNLWFIFIPITTLTIGFCFKFLVFSKKNTK